MSIDFYEDVMEFHRKFDLFMEVPDKQTQVLRVDLIDEEYVELIDALADEDLPAIADAAADLIYVVVGLCISYGIDVRKVWDEVQRANLDKVGGEKGPNGKKLKPPNWRPPDIKRVLREQGWECGVTS